MKLRVCVCTGTNMVAQTTVQWTVSGPGSRHMVGVFVSIDGWNSNEGAMASGLNMGSRRMSQLWGSTRYAEYTNLLLTCFLLARGS